MNKKIATSYPPAPCQFLAENNLTATTEEISGSVEIAPGIGLAEAVLRHCEFRKHSDDERTEGS